MVILVSPGLAVSEFDQTTVVPAVSTTIGGFAGAFQWGPANTIVSVQSENQLKGRFLGPDANTYLSFFTAANFLQYGNNLSLIRALGPNANNASVVSGALLIENDKIWEYNFYAGGGSSAGEWAARFAGSAGNALRVSICPSNTAFQVSVTGTVANSPVASVSAGSNLVTFNAAVNSVVVTGDLIQLGSNNYVSVTNVAANGLMATLITASNVSLANVAVNRQWAYASYFAGPPGTSNVAAQVGGVNDQMHVAVIDTLGQFTIQGANTVLEVYPFVSKGFDAKNYDGTSNYVRDVVFQKSQYIHWMSNLAAGTNWGNSIIGTSFTNVITNKYSNLGGGVTDTPGDGPIVTVLGKFLNKEYVPLNLLMAGAADTTVGNYVLSIAMARQDCLAFVSPQFTDVVNAPGAEVNNILATRNAYPSTSYGVMDSNWKYQFDKYNSVYRWIPLNGDIAGLCVYTDVVRDPWWSPAGFTRGQIRNAIRLAWNPKQADRDTLYKNNVNPVVTFPGQGTLLFGDKTMQAQPSAFDRINVRRLFLVLEAAISQAAKFSLFEFNDSFTQAQFVNLVEPYLRQVQGRRGIVSFLVKCDSTNNPPSVVASNQFVGDIYIQPNYSINFIQLNFTAINGSSISFTEQVGTTPSGGGTPGTFSGSGH